MHRVEGDMNTTLSQFAREAIPRLERLVRDSNETGLLILLVQDWDSSCTFVSWPSLGSTEVPHTRSLFYRSFGLQRERRQRYGTVNVCRNADLPPLFRVGGTRRFGLPGVVNGVTTK